jgi:hypothetical protein
MYRVLPGRQQEGTIAMSTEVTPIQERIRQHLIEERAKKADPARPFVATISYLELCAAVDPDQRKPRFRGIGPALRAVSLYEHAVWRAEVERVVRCWTGPGKDQAEADPAERALALLATIAGELEEARRLLGAA